MLFLPLSPGYLLASFPPHPSRSWCHGNKTSYHGCPCNNICTLLLLLFALLINTVYFALQCTPAMDYMTDEHVSGFSACVCVAVLYSVAVVGSSRKPAPPFWLPTSTA